MILSNAGLTALSVGLLAGFNDVLISVTYGSYYWCNLGFCLGY
jgi:hypothetical protein